MRTDFSDVSFKNDGRLRLLVIVGTRPEVIRLSEVVKKCREHFDCLLAHTGQNYDYSLNGVFFRDLELGDADVYLDAAGEDLGETIGAIVDASYKLMAAVRPDALLVLGDTNSCLSAIPAKRLHIPIFHMEAGNRCKDERLPEETNRRIVDIISDVNLAYSEHARRYLAECGCAPERTFVTGSPMAEVLRANLPRIDASGILGGLGLEPERYMLLSAHREENVDDAASLRSLFGAVNALAERYGMPILYSCHPRSRKRLAEAGLALHPLVRMHEPLGFHDYNKLQLDWQHLFGRFRQDQPRLPELDGAHVAERRVDPEVVVPVHVVGQLGLQVAEAGEAVPVDQLRLEYLVRRLVDRVVVGAALGGERPLDAERLKHEVDLGVVELAAAVGVEDLDVRDRELQGREGCLDELRPLAASRRAADDLPVVEVDEQADVAPGAAGAHVGEVAADVRARSVPVEGPVEHVRQLRLVRLARVRLEALPPVRAREAVLPHDAGYPPAARDDAAPLERRLDLPRAVPALALRMDGENVGLDGVRRGRGLRARAEVVVGRARHAEDLALR